MTPPPLRRRPQEAMSEVPDMETAEYAASDAEGDDDDDEEAQEPSRPRPPVPLPPADTVSSILVIDGFRCAPGRRRLVAAAD